MPADHFERFFVLAAIGLGLLLAGGLNLAFGRSGRRVWLRMAVTLAACGAVVAGLAAFTRPELGMFAGIALLGTVAIVFVLGSEWLSRRVAGLFAGVRTPAVRWGLLTLGGLVVVLGGAVAFEQTDDAIAEEAYRELDLLVGKPDMRSVEQVKATTDRGTVIVLKEATAPRDTSEMIGPEEKSLRDGQFRDHVIRQGSPSEHSNCHGWTFTGGKFFVLSEDVDRIVKENGYQEVPLPQPGDLVVYRQNGTVSHTGIVRYVTEGQPVLVESKWGTLGVYLHAAEKSYYGTQFTFYRSARTGHLLVGVGGSAGPDSGATTTEE